MIDNEIALLEKVLHEQGETVHESQIIVNNEKKRKNLSNSSSNSANSNKPLTLSIDTNEPLYCICQRIAFGEMIACDNEDCPIEWFHYECVNLTKEPRNSSWLCPQCSHKKKK
jgi:hypothetical protein